MTTLNLDVNRTIEVALFLTTKTAELNHSWLAEICYQADRLSLTMYGRVITGATYSIRAGKIASDDLLSLVDECQSVTESDGVISGLREVDEDELSGSDIDCLNTVVSIFLLSMADKEDGILDYSDTYPKVEEDRLISLEELASTVDNIAELRKHLFLK